MQLLHIKRNIPLVLFGTVGVVRQTHTAAIDRQRLRRYDQSALSRQDVSVQAAGFATGIYVLIYVVNDLNLNSPVLRLMECL